MSGRFGRARASAALVLVLVVVLASSAAAGPVGFPTLSNLTVTGATSVSLAGVSCPAGGSCVAVGVTKGGSPGANGPVVVEETASGWQSSRPGLPPDVQVGNSVNALAAVSCVSAGACVAVGGYEGTHGESPLVATETGSQWQPSVAVQMPSNSALFNVGSFDGVSCTSSGCAAVGTYQGPSGNEAMISTETNGRWAPASEVTDSPGGSSANSALAAVSCDGSHCRAVGVYTAHGLVPAGMAIPITLGGAIGQPVTVDAPSDSADVGTTLTGVSCTSSSVCAISGFYTASSDLETPMLASIDGSTVSDSRALEAPVGAPSNTVSMLRGISCASTGNCVAAGSFGNASGVDQPLDAVESSGTWAQAVAVGLPAGDSGANLDAVGCTAFDQCAVAGATATGDPTASTKGVVALSSEHLVVPTVPVRQTPGVVAPKLPPLGPGTVPVVKVTMTPSVPLGPGDRLSFTVTVKNGSAQPASTPAPTGTVTLSASSVADPAVAICRVSLSHGAGQCVGYAPDAHVPATTSENAAAGAPLDTAHDAYTAVQARYGGDPKHQVASTSVPLQDMSWNSVAIDAGRTLTSVSCPTSRFCVAVDASGNAIVYNGSRWLHRLSLDPGHALVSVSCPSSQFCMTVDDVNSIIAFNGTHWSTPATAGRITVDTNGSIRQVSCVSIDFCVLAGQDGGGNGIVVMDDHGDFSSPVQLAQAPGSPAGAVGLWSVSCVSSRFCATDDQYGNVDYYDGSSWSQGHTVDPAVDVGGVNSTISEISCAATDACRAIDFSGHELEEVPGTENWAIPFQIGPSETGVQPSLAGLSCPSTTFCVATDSLGNVLTYDGTSWATSEQADPGHLQPVDALASQSAPSTLVAVSCATSVFCVALDGSAEGVAYVGSG